MRRDPSLIRKLLLDLEESNGPIADDHHVEGWTRDQVAYHLAQILNADLAEGPAPTYYMDNADTAVPSSVLVLRLTPAGHDLIDAIRSDAVWKRTLDKVSAVGGSVTIEVLKQLAVSASRQILGI